MERRSNASADDHPVPTIYSGFRVLYLKEQFHPSGTGRSSFRTGDGENPEEIEAWTQISNATFLDDLARITQLPRDGLLTALRVMEDTPGRFFTDVKIEGEHLSWRVNDSERHWKFSKLGGAEQQFVILDIFLRLAEFSARFSPTVLILNQHAFGSLDSPSLIKLLKTLGEFELQCQLIVSLYRWPDELSQDHWSVWHLHADSDRSPVTIHEGLPEKRVAKLPAKSVIASVNSQNKLQSL